MFRSEIVCYGTICYGVAFGRQPSIKDDTR